MFPRPSHVHSRATAQWQPIPCIPGHTAAKYVTSILLSVFPRISRTVLVRRSDGYATVSQARQQELNLNLSGRLGDKLPVGVVTTQGKLAAALAQASRYVRQSVRLGGCAGQHVLQQLDGAC